MELIILECAILWSMNVSIAQYVKARLRAKLTWEQKLKAESDKLISHNVVWAIYAQSYAVIGICDGLLGRANTYLMRSCT